MVFCFVSFLCVKFVTSVMNHHCESNNRNLFNQMKSIQFTLTLVVTLIIPLFFYETTVVTMNDDVHALKKECVWISLKNITERFINSSVVFLLFWNNKTIMAMTYTWTNLYDAELRIRVRNVYVDNCAINMWTDAETLYL